MTIRLAAVLLLITSLSGCFVPLKRVYYNPNPTDGTPVKTVSCGWFRTSEDGLKRNVAGLSLRVGAGAIKDDRIQYVFVSFDSAFQGQTDASMIEVRGGKDRSLIPVLNTESKIGPYLRTIRVTFAPVSAPEEIEVRFLPGFMRIDGKQVDVAPFRFEKVNTVDVYTVTINC